VLDGQQDVPAQDEEELRSLTELLLDASRSDGGADSGLADTSSSSKATAHSVHDAEPIVEPSV
jgi:hypothetical protein